MSDPFSIVTAARATALCAEKSSELEVTTSGVIHVTRRYAPIVYAAGPLLRCLVASESKTTGLIETLVAGGILGYSVRAYISHLRRRRYLSV